ncbi:MAG: ATP-grasp domain-containing protein [Anaerolineales bacterium]|nr:ATP-grasp domain-containing protein [Anaerolineales bacterium]
MIGYSARLLAELALAAGQAVVALDYFGDVDLRAMCPSRSLRHDFGGRAYSAPALAAAAREIPAAAVVYGASFENHPDLVAALAKGRRLLGNTPATLRQTRDPLRLAAALRDGGFAFPATYPIETPPEPGQRQWLYKPLHSGGGHGVRRWRGGPTGAPGIIQERRPGMVGSAAFVADGRRAAVLGLTEQLVGRRAFGAAGFRYAGNLTPPRLPARARAELARQAQAVVAHLTAAFGLRGVNGLDFVWHAGRLWTLEVNARPSASLELFDAAQPGWVFAAHRAGCRGRLATPPSPASNEPARGKAVLFAAEDVVVGDTAGWAARGRRDIPHPGEVIQKGHPICTVLATARTAEACLAALRRQAAAVRRELTALGVSA